MSVCVNIFEKRIQTATASQLLCFHNVLGDLQTLVKCLREC